MSRVVSVILCSSVTKTVFMLLCPRDINTSTRDAWHINVSLVPIIIMIMEEKGIGNACHMTSRFTIRCVGETL